MVESIKFNGIIFRRYEDAEAWADRMYYTPGGGSRVKGIGRLHEEIWKAVHGDIPTGHHIHHLDFNPLNNEPANLVCLTMQEHAAVHAARGIVSQAKIDNLNRIRHLTKEWHASPEGIEWHRQQATESFKKRISVQRTCEQCGTEFGSITRRDNDRFCSNACKSTWRRTSRIDDESRTCAFCGTIFVVNRYAKTRCCSRRCGGLLRSLR